MSTPTAIELDVPPLSVLHRRRGWKWSAVAPDVLSLTVAEMDYPLAAPIVTALKRAIDASDMGYARPATGTLADALVAFARERLDWSIDPGRVTVVPDVVSGVVELCRILVGDDRPVAFTTPAYSAFYAALPGAGFRIREIALHADDTIDLDDLDRALAEGIGAMIVVNPDNPTGHVLERPELAAIAERCAGAGVTVIADEIHAPLVLPGATHTPWLEVSDAAREYGIALISASKAFNLAAFKTAFIVTGSERAQRLVRSLEHAHAHAGLLGEVAAEAAFRDGGPWLDTVLAQLDANRALLGRLLAEQLPQIRWRPPQGTYLAWLDCRALGLGADPAETFVQRGRVALAHGRAYGQAGEGFARLNFATSPEHLTEAVRRLAGAIG